MLLLLTMTMVELNRDEADKVAKLKQELSQSKTTMKSQNQNQQTIGYDLL